MKKVFGSRKHVKADYESSKLLIIFKKISKKEVLGLEISRLELNLKKKEFVY